MRIAIATSSRADWGILSPLAHSLADAPGTEVEVVATNMHLLESAGMTVSEIEADGFDPVRLPVKGNPAEITAQTLQGFGKILPELRPDALIILGDRYEMAAAALAATLCGVPIIHIAGGTVSEGAFDDSFRHAITKMATLHLCETDEHRRRIIQMGEDPQTVIATGALGVYNLFHLPAVPKEELEKFLGMKIDKPTILATLHPATLETIAPTEQMANMLEAFEKFSELKYIITYPNNDSDPEPLIALIENFAARHPERVVALPSLGARRYLSALKYVCAVVGNSSSGIVEVPSAGIPTLDIGIRQQGRQAGPAVIHCGASTENIVEGMRKILSEEVREIGRRKENPYFRPDTLALMKESILQREYRPFPQKKFHNQ